MFRNISLWTILVAVVLAGVMAGCADAKPHRRVDWKNAEGQPGLFTGAAGEFTVFEWGGDNKKR